MSHEATQTMNGCVRDNKLDGQIRKVNSVLFQFRINFRLKNGNDS